MARLAGCQAVLFCAGLLHTVVSANGALTRRALRGRAFRQLDTSLTGKPYSRGTPRKAGQGQAVRCRHEHDREDWLGQLNGTTHEGVHWGANFAG